MKRADFLSSKKFNRKPLLPFVKWGEGSPDQWSIGIVYDLGPGSFFEDRENTFYNAIGLDGYPTSYGSMQNFKEHPFVVASQQWQDKVEELYTQAKSQCKKLGYDVSKLP